MSARHLVGPTRPAVPSGTVAALALAALVVTGALGCASPEPCPVCDAVEAHDVARVRTLAASASRDDKTVALGMALINWDRATGPEMAFALLDAGADPNGTWAFKTMGRSTAHFLELAVYDYSPEVVSRLIEKGADVKGPAGGFALLKAANGQNVKIARLLLDAGANVAFEFKGETPLALASRAGDAETEKLLRERGAVR